MVARTAFLCTWDSGDSLALCTDPCSCHSVYFSWVTHICSPGSIMASGPRNPWKWTGPSLASSVLHTSCLLLREAFQGWREGAVPPAGRRVLSSLQRYVPCFPSPSPVSESCEPWSDSQVRVQNRVNSQKFLLSILVVVFGLHLIPTVNINPAIFELG